MPRRANFEITSTEKGWLVNVPAKYSSTGARQRRYFEKQVEAEGFVRTLNVQIENYGLSAQLLKPTDAEQALAAMRLLRDAGSTVSLLEVARLYVASEKKRKHSKPLARTFDAFLESKTVRSAKYTKSIIRARNRFAPLRDYLVSDITPEAIEELITGASDSYRNSLLGQIRAVFGFAVKRRWCAENPVSQLEFASLEVGEREIYTTKEASTILHTADTHAPGLLPFVAIGLFAGIRVFEILRLEWSHIDLEEGSIDLPAKITKRKRRRSVPIEPALRAWLLHDISERGIRSGPVVPVRTYNALRKRLRALFSAAKVEWRQNAARHSYASYWLGAHHDLTKLALYLGHVGGLQVLHTYYNRAVKRSDSENYWNLRPPECSDPNIAVAFTA